LARVLRRVRMLTPALRPQSIIGSRPMYRRARRRKARSHRFDGLRQTLGVIAVGVLIGTSLFATGEYVTALQRASAAAAAAAANDEEIYTGSILYMPDEGRACHQLLFDNHTGRFTDNGYVDCENAAYGGAGGQPRQWSSARVRVISTGFRHH
jgi:hypothetical protein